MFFSFYIYLLHSRPLEGLQNLIRVTRRGDVYISVSSLYLEANQIPLDGLLTPNRVMR
jgi:hypothetical protein